MRKAISVAAEYELGHRRVQLIVGLPTDHVRILPIVLGHGRGDAAAVGAVDGARRIRMLARSMAGRSTVRVDAQHFGVIGCQPARRRRGGRAEDRFDAGLTQDVDRLVEEVKIKPALPWLEDMPGELSHADHVEAGRRHPLGVALPAALFDLLGIMRSANEEVVETKRTPDGGGCGRGAMHDETSASIF